MNVIFFEGFVAFAGRKEEARRLEKSGQDAEIWYSSYLPEGTRDFSDYLYEKLRGHVRKQKRGEKRKELDETFQIAKEVLNLN